jgi:hypothetical protein
MDKAKHGILQFYAAAIRFNIQIFWNMAPRRIPNSDVLGGTYCLHLQGATILLNFPRRCLPENGLTCNFFSAFKRVLKGTYLLTVTDIQ